MSAVPLDDCRFFNPLITLLYSTFDRSAGNKKNIKNPARKLSATNVKNV